VTLRKKLVFLTTGIIIFPFLAAVITFLSLFLLFPGQESGSLDFMNLTNWMYNDFIPAVSEGEPPPEPPEFFPFIFLSPDNIVLLSTIGSFPPGTQAASPETASGALGPPRGSGDRLIVMQQITRNGQLAGTAVAAIAVDIDSYIFNLNFSQNYTYNRNSLSYKELSSFGVGIIFSPTHCLNLL
jgi:hypothetical protein